MDEHQAQAYLSGTLIVSRETMARLELYVALLRKWQAKINLVAPSTLESIWSRHILDSAQLWPHLPSGTERLVDMGSGAGFPGLVLAILGVPQVHLLESDSRKAAFLREAARQTAATVTIHNARIERVPAFPVQVVTARALASLADLLALAAPFLGNTEDTLGSRSGVGLFLKGQSWEEELTAARKGWNMQIESFASLTDTQARVLRLSTVTPRRSQDTE